MWTYGSQVPGYPKGFDWSEAEEPVDWARELLQARPDVSVIVAPELFASFQASMPSELRDRVLTWGLP